MNIGHMFIRFSDAEFMEEVKDYITNVDVSVACNVTGNKRELRCRLAQYDLGGKDYCKKVNNMERARYFDDCFHMMEL